MEEIEIGRDCTLKVKNFLCLKDVECEFKGINVLIGPQAEGKSLIAKLVFFFQEFLFNSITEGIVEDKSISDIFEDGKNNFYAYFPGESWREQAFLIDFTIGRYSLSISNNNKISFTCNNFLSEELSDLISKIDIKRNEHLNQFEEEPDEETALTKFDPTMLIPKHLWKSLLFVPAQRNMLSTLHDNIFTTIREKGYIDPLLISYGSKFESINSYIRFTSRNLQTKHDGSVISTRNAFLDRINFDLGNIIKGEYGVSDNDTLIKTQHGDVKLQYASSGQQEVAPLAPIAIFNYSTVLIEEPEAHLYPSSQKKVIEFISDKYNRNAGSSYTITTHSPYILTTINNLIAASNACSTKNKKNKVEAIIPSTKWISFKEVTAWYVNEGTAKSIMDPESKLIDANAIDDVSDQLAAEFDALLDIQYGE
jgi:AAA15 family ATPase/GTPase